MRVPGTDLASVAMQTKAWWPMGASFAADFTTANYFRTGIIVGFAEACTFVRASGKLAQDMAGRWHWFGENRLARTGRGALIEPAATNLVPNNTNLSGWSASGVSVSGLGDGIFRLNNSSQANNARITNENIVAAGQAIVRSVLVKSDGAALASLHSSQFQSGSAPWMRVAIDFSTKVVTANGGTAGPPSAYGATELGTRKNLMF